MSFGDVRALGKKVYVDINNNHTMAMAAGLSYYFVMSLFPMLILAAALVAYLPVPDLFDSIIAAMARVVPSDSMGLVRTILKDVLTPNRGGFLTIGVLGTLWSASGGFASLIEALNMAYDVPETRPWWKTRLLAVGLMAIIGTLLIMGSVMMFLGPHFGFWIAEKLGLDYVYALMWPVVRWVLAIGFTVLGVELVYYWAPNVKQKFLSTLPGAAIGVGFFIGTSFLLGIYFREIAQLNKTYGTLGAAVGLMIWLYYSWFMILVGAELDSELLKAQCGGKMELKQGPPSAIRVQPAWKEEGAA